MKDTVSVTASILGMLLGTAGFVMSILVYLRDRASVKITLQWKMQILETGESQGLIRITNTGRRAVFISIVALELPKGFKHSHLILTRSIGGKKLGEGDEPLLIPVSYDEGLEQYSNVWRKISAYAEDSTGKRYHSQLPRKDEETPPWVKK